VLRLSSRAAVLGLLLVLPGCDYVQDRFRECKHVRVELVHRRVLGEPVNLVPEHEAYALSNLVVPGQSRGMDLCVERGDVKRFRVGIGGQTKAITNCVVSRSTYEYEASVLRVVWTDHDTLLCEGW
jgi:hypothetical protein